MIRFQKFSFALRSSLFVLGVGVSVFALTGCDMATNQVKHDRAAHAEFQDFRDALSSRVALHDQQQDMEGDDSGIPSLQSYVAPPSENLRPMPLVSVSVNQTVPLRDVLFELAKQADYDVELDPNIRGSIIFTAREKPFDVVIDRIANISGLRYNFDDDVLRVELDTPYSKTYKIDYLNFVRTSTSSIRNDIAVVTGDGANTGSGFEAASESEANFWDELTNNLEQMLGVRMSQGGLVTEDDPMITAVEKNPAPVESAAVSGEGEDGEVVVQAPEAVLQVNSLPTAVGGQQASSAGQTDGPNKDPGFSLNRQAGMVSVYATERQHEEVREYFRELKRSVTSQVLVEAKILEVSLIDEFNTGVDWSNFSLSGKAALDILLPQQNFLDGTGPGNLGATLTVGGNDVNAVMNALQKFGTVRALASPRITVLNNQSAVLNVAQNLVYFEVDIETTQSDSSTTTTIESEIRNVPEGVLINVQPSINLDDRTISMSIRPTITNVDQFENDPAIEITAAQAGVAGQVTSRIPVVQVQEFDSIISMNSGEAVVMGGLMQDRTRSNEQGVPILSELPLLGGAFRSHVDEITKTELIVFLKATIVDSNTVHNTDREFYKTFSQDRRPLNL